MSVKEFMTICDKMGTRNLGEHFALLAKSFTELNSTIDSDVKTTKKKVITSSRLRNFLNLRGK